MRLSEFLAAKVSKKVLIAMQMTRAEDELIKNEGMKLRLYKCTKGKWTIGVGRNVEDMGISEEEAIYLFRNDLRRCRKELSNFLWFKTQDKVRQDVLVEMCFNMGLPSLLSFDDMISALMKHDYDAAAKEMYDSKWRRKDVGSDRSLTMIYRMRNGKYMA